MKSSTSTTTDDIIPVCVDGASPMCCFNCIGGEAETLDDHDLAAIKINQVNKMDKTIIIPRRRKITPFLYINPSGSVGIGTDDGSTIELPSPNNTPGTLKTLEFLALYSPGM